MAYRTALILIGIAFVVLFLVNVCMTYLQWKMTRVQKPRATHRNKKTTLKVVKHVPPSIVQVARCKCSFCQSRNTSVQSNFSPGARGRRT